VRKIQAKLMELECCIKGAALDVMEIRAQLLQLTEIVFDIVEKMPDREEVEGNDLSKM